MRGPRPTLRAADPLRQATPQGFRRTTEEGQPGPPRPAPAAVVFLALSVLPQGGGIQRGEGEAAGSRAAISRAEKGGAGRCKAAGKRGPAIDAWRGGREEVAALPTNLQEGRIHGGRTPAVATLLPVQQDGPKASVEGGA
ncbi:uncharacterized protein PHA67_009359 [Liasis olivaceus]